MRKSLLVLGAVALLVASFVGGVFARYGTQIGGYRTVGEWSEMHEYYLNGYTQGVADAVVAFSDPDLSTQTVMRYIDNAADCIRNRAYTGNDLRAFVQRHLGDKAGTMQLASSTITIYAECGP